MNAAPLAAPSRPATDTREPDVYHLVCCDPDTALCGEDVSDVEFRARQTGEALCPLCKLAEDVDAPCPGCPDYRNGAAS